MFKGVITEQEQKSKSKSKRARAKEQAKETIYMKVWLVIL